MNKSPPESERVAETLVIEGVTLISPEREGPVGNMSVLIRDDKIVAVGAASEVKAPSGAKIISGKGKFLIPGLIDAHVHLASVPGVDLDNPPKDAGLIDRYFEQLPRSYLYYGYTTLVDLAAAKPQVLADFRAQPLSPDLYDCGASLPIANGYPMAFFPPNMRFKHFPGFIYDPAQAGSIPVEYAPENHTPAASVARVKAAGGICVKTYWEPGFGRKMNFPVASQEILKEITRASKEAGLISLVHANSLQAQEQVVDSGFDIIAHGMWNWGPVSPVSPISKESGLPVRVTQVLDKVIARKIGYMPTIQVIGGTQLLSDPGFLKDPHLAKVLPAELISYYRSPKGKWFRELIERDEGIKLTLKVHEPILSRIGRVVQYLAKRDAQLIFGTDTPSAPTYGNPPGYNGYLEMKRWTSYGVPLKKLLYSATLGNARALKLDSSVGSIETGKVANVLLLRKNPYESVEGYESLDSVILRGRHILRPELAAKN